MTLKIQSENPTVAIWNMMGEGMGIWLVKVSDAPEDFSSWLNGQTLPLVEEDEEPTNWAYYADYTRWLRGAKVVD